MNKDVSSSDILVQNIKFFILIYAEWQQPRKNLNSTHVVSHSGPI